MNFGILFLKIGIFVSQHTELLSCKQQNLQFILANVDFIYVGKCTRQVVLVHAAKLTSLQYMLIFDVRFTGQFCIFL